MRNTKSILPDWQSIQLFVKFIIASYPGFPAIKQEDINNHQYNIDILHALKDPVLLLEQHVVFYTQCSFPTTAKRSSTSANKYL